MDHHVSIVCLAGFVLLAVLAVPVAAGPTIYSISPSSGYNNGTLTGVVITGANFNLTSSLGSVVLMKSGQSNITAYIPSPSSSNAALTCQFALSGQPAGTWDVIVVNQDGSSFILASGFTLRNAMALASVSPASALANNTSVAVTVTGTGLSSVSSLYLYNSNYSNRSASIGTLSATSVQGTFDLTNANPATYLVCVGDTAGTTSCGLSFAVTTDQTGEIDISSDPTGAYIYLDSKYVGNTPDALTGLTPGTHVVKVSKNGYSDWSEIVKVTSGSTTTIKASLSAATTAVATTIPTSAPTTTKTPLKVTTVKVPTPWGTPTTTTKASPVDAAIIIGAIGIGAFVLRWNT